MTREVEIHAGGGFDALGARVSDALKRHADGQDVREDHLTFSDWDALSKTMTVKRLELLRYLHRNPRIVSRHWQGTLAATIAWFTKTWIFWSQPGLIDRNGLALRIGYDEIRAVIAL